MSALRVTAFAMALLAAAPALAQVATDWPAGTVMSRSDRSSAPTVCSIGGGAASFHTGVAPNTFFINLPGIAGDGGPNSFNVVVPAQVGQPGQQVLEYYGSARFVFAAGSSSSGDVFIEGRRREFDFATAWPKLKFSNFSATPSTQQDNLKVRMIIHVHGANYGCSVPFVAEFHR